MPSSRIVGTGVTTLIGKREDGDRIGREVEIVGYAICRLTTGESFVAGVAMADREISN